MRSTTPLPALDGHRVVRVEVVETEPKLLGPVDIGQDFSVL